MSKQEKKQINDISGKDNHTGKFKSGLNFIRELYDGIRDGACSAKLSKGSLLVFSATYKFGQHVQGIAPKAAAGFACAAVILLSCFKKDKSNDKPSVSEDTKNAINRGFPRKR